MTGIKSLTFFPSVFANSEVFECDSCHGLENFKNDTPLSAVSNSSMAIRGKLQPRVEVPPVALLLQETEKLKSC